jgi:hypothetical protein
LYERSSPDSFGYVKGSYEKHESVELIVKMDCMVGERRKMGGREREGIYTDVH